LFAAGAIRGRRAAVVLPAATAVGRYGARMMWWPPDQWARMVDGTDCPMCIDAHLPTNAHSDLILATDVEFWRLHHNQTHAGYCVVILKRHVAELQQLDQHEDAAFWRAVRDVSRAVASVFEPVKLDTLVMGHLCPHVHCHIYPQYQSDDPHALIDIQSGDVRLPDRERDARIAQLRTAYPRSA
jgi:diadenosine tetraphosphate (Ap4A) HIT family hydrolase